MKPFKPHDYLGQITWNALEPDRELKVIKTISVRLVQKQFL